jgi:hypothetical protein
MRTFLRIIILFICTFLYPVWIFLAAFGLSGISAQWLKQTLVTTNTYPLLVESLNKTIDSAMQKQDSSGNLQVIAPIVRKEITPKLVRQKAERFIDDTSDWLTGKTLLPPTVNFIELKDILIAENPDLARQFNLTASSESRTNEPVEPEFDYGVPHPTQLSLVDQAINDKMTFPIGKNFAFIKILYDGVRGILMGLTVMIIIGGGVIYWVSSSPKSGWRWLGITGLFFIFWNIVPFIFLISPTLLISFIKSHIDSSFASLVPVLLKPVLLKIVLDELIITAVLGFTSFTLLIVSFFLKDASA